MTTSFLEGAGNAPAVRVAIDLSVSEPDPHSKPGREAVRLLAIGSPDAVRTLIHRLHNLGFAEAGTWSRFMPTGNPGEIMSILIWYSR